MFVKLKVLPLYGKVLEKRVHLGHRHLRCLAGFRDQPLDIYLFHGDDVEQVEPPAWLLEEIEKWPVR